MCSLLSHGGFGRGCTWVRRLIRVFPPTPSPPSVTLIETQGGKKMKSLSAEPMLFSQLCLILISPLPANLFTFLSRKSVTVREDLFIAKVSSMSRCAFFFYFAHIVSLKVPSLFHKRWLRSSIVPWTRWTWDFDIFTSLTAKISWSNPAVGGGD